MINGLINLFNCQMCLVQKCAPIGNDVALSGAYGSCFSRYQTGLTQMSDTVIGGSTGLGLSGGQVSC